MARVSEAVFVLLLGLSTFTLLTTAQNKQCANSTIGSTSSVTITQVPSAYIIGYTTGNLTLTCNTTNTPPNNARYFWSQGDASTQFPSCLGRNNICTFHPQDADIKKPVICEVPELMNEKDACVPVIYKLPSKPVINVTRSKEPLGPGDSLTCHVEGGHPPVESISFTCSKPDHVGDSGVLNGDRRSSTIMMSNFKDEGDGKMNCTCSATWAPKPALYNHTEIKTVEIQFEPFIINFSKVDSPPPSQNTTLIVSCVVIARPPLTITIKHPNGTTFKEERFTSKTDNNVYVLNATLNKECLKGVQCIATNAIASDTEQKTRRRRRRATGSATLDCAGQSQSASSASLGLGLGLGLGGAAVLVCVVVVVVLLVKRRRQSSQRNKKNQQKVETEVVLQEGQDIEMSVPATRRENRTGAYEEAWDINNLTPGEKTTAIVQRVADDVPADGALYSTVGAKHSGLVNQSTRQPEVNPGGPDGADQTYNRIGDVTRKAPENFYDRTN